MIKWRICMHFTKLRMRSAIDYTVYRISGTTGARKLNFVCS